MSNYASKKEIEQKRQEKIRAILFVPIMILLGIIPLIVRLKIAQPTEQVASTYKLQDAVDFFSYYKATFILIVTIAIFLLVFFTINKEDFKKFKAMLVTVCASGVFLLFTILSTSFSPYKQEALWGVPGRMEGMLVIACYVMMMLFTIYAFINFKNYRYIIWALAFLVAVLTFLGIFEYMGKNFFLTTNLGKKLLVPNEYASYRDSVNVTYEKGKVYGTLFHYNYMGSFGALMVPLFATLAVGIKGIKEKVFLSIFTAASLFLLFGSTSRGGLIGVAAAVVFAFVLFGGKMIQGWKVTLPVVLVFAIVTIGLNFLSGGTIFQRIPTLLNDAAAGLTGSAKDFNYLDHIPLRDIKVQDGRATLVTQTDALTIEKEENGIKLYDKAGKEVAFAETNTELTVQDERFQGIILKKILDNKNNWGGILLNINGLDTFVFRISAAEGIYLIDSATQQKISVDFPETFGFKGKEKLGSSRGYIWSRSIPMLKHTWFIGHGPDTFAFDFPQNDFLGKYYAYDTPSMIVDKPHNLFLQIGINEGLIALLAFLVLVIGYIVSSIKLYAFKTAYENKEIIGVATVLSVIGYIGAGLFNDSVVSVAPIFWILLGSGIGINYLNKNQKSEN